MALLKERKKALEKREKELASKETQFDRAGVEGLAKRRFFYAPAFNIYGGEPGIINIRRSIYPCFRMIMIVTCTLLYPLL